MKESITHAMTSYTKGTIGFFFLDYNNLAGKAFRIFIFHAVRPIAHCT